MEDKLLLPGTGSKILELLLEEILVINLLVIPILWNNVIIMLLIPLEKNVMMLNKLTLLVEKLVLLETMLIILKINILLHLHMDFHLLIKSKLI